MTETVRDHSLLKVDYFDTYFDDIYSSASGG